MASNNIPYEVFNEVALSDTFVYKSFNKNAELSSILTAAARDSIVIDEKYIAEQLFTIKRIKLSPIADDVIASFLEGNIVILYSNVKKVPSILPFFTTKNGGKIRTYIFMNNFAKIVKDKTDLNRDYLEIPAKHLYALMEGAYISYQYALYPNKIQRNIGLLRTCSDVYTSMVMRILNKEYALSMDTEAYDKVAFCVSQFFVESVWGLMNGEQIFSYARQNKTIKDNNASYFGSIHDEYDGHNIHTIDGLIDFIKTLTPRLSSLSSRYFYQRWIETYRYSASFAIESLPYFLYVMSCTIIGCFIINSPLIADMSKDVKGIKNYYSELEKVL